MQDKLRNFCSLGHWDRCQIEFNWHYWYSIYRIGWCWAWFVTDEKDNSLGAENCRWWWEHVLTDCHLCPIFVVRVFCSRMRMTPPHVVLWMVASDRCVRSLSQPHSQQQSPCWWLVTGQPRLQAAAVTCEEHYGTIGAAARLITAANIALIWPQGRLTTEM